MSEWIVKRRMDVPGDGEVPFDWVEEEHHPVFVNGWVNG